METFGSPASPLSFAMVLRGVPQGRQQLLLSQRQKVRDHEPGLSDT